MSILTSIVYLPEWKRLKDYLLVDIYSRERGASDPRIRIGFVDLPEAWSRDLVTKQMPCVACERPIFPLRRREGDGWDRLYYSPTCPLVVRIACSRSRAAELEYERFMGLWERRQDAQLRMFG